MSRNPIIVAVDTPDIYRAKELCTQLRGHVGAVKLGLEFFSAHGPEGVREVLPEGMPLFLDLKFHDIPNTVGKAICALKGLPIHLLTIHTLGGAPMMRAAVEAADWLASQGQARPNVLGVTVLTSMDEADMEQIGVQLDVAKQVEKLALLAQQSGLDGVVCSPQEIEMLRRILGHSALLSEQKKSSSTQVGEQSPSPPLAGEPLFTTPLAGGLGGAVSSDRGRRESPPLTPPASGVGISSDPQVRWEKNKDLQAPWQNNNMLLVTPGIRPAGAAMGDQKRVMTPAEAISAGADYLVIGRPITEAKDPVTLCGEILSTLG